jgi:hypothetical protein
MTVIFLLVAAFLFYFFWRWARYYLKPFASTYFGLGLWFLWVSLFSVLFHFWR